MRADRRNQNKYVFIEPTDENAEVITTRELDPCFFDRICPHVNQAERLTADMPPRW
jgi:hypothetical protein